MSFPSISRRKAILGAACSLLLAACGSLPTESAVDRQVVLMTSGGFASTSEELVPAFEQSRRIPVRIVYGSSMGGAADSIPSRLNRNEPADVVILARTALDELVAKGQVIPGSQVDLVHSLIGIAVRKGAPKPDISTPEAVRQALLGAPSIAYSASASGTYYEREMLKSLGIEEQVKPKSKRIVSERVGTIVARGEASMGLQQVSELLPIEGIDFVGALPAPLQRTTTFSAGVTTHARDPKGAQELIQFLVSKDAAPVILKNGLVPASKN